MPCVLRSEPRAQEWADTAMQQIEKEPSRAKQTNRDESEWEGGVQERGRSYL